MGWKCAQRYKYKTNTIYRQGGWIFPWLWVLAWPAIFFVTRKRPILEESFENPASAADAFDEETSDFDASADESSSPTAPYTDEGDEQG